MNEANKFFDINKFPAKEGMLVFPISMSRIGNSGQDAKTYWEYVEYFNPSKMDKTKEKSKVGAIFIYTDFLYMTSNKKAVDLKKKFMNQMVLHKNNFKNIIKGHPHLIHESISFKVWSQFYIENLRFIDYLEKIKSIYNSDKQFQKYLNEDFKNMKNSKFKFDENQIDFFLEEHLMLYLISKGQMELQNKFIHNHEKWILIAYPGKPLKAHIYLHQLNPFKLENKENKYQDSWYDLEEKKLYDFNNIDLKTLQY